MGQVYNMPYDSSYNDTATMKAKGLLIWTDQLPDNSYKNFRMLMNVDGVKGAACIAAENPDIYRIYFASTHVFSWSMSAWDASSDAFFNVNSYTAAGDTYNVGTAYSARNSSFGYNGADRRLLLSYYNNDSEAIAALANSFVSSSITYRLSNCTAPSAPQSASSGDTVTVNLVPDTGFVFVAASDVYVTNNGVVVASTLSGNTLTFTMP